MCKVEGCEGKVFVKSSGLCSKHYNRLRVTGTVDDGPYARAPVEERFWRYVDKRGDNECWHWKGGHGGSGHGIIQVGGRDGYKTNAHRISYVIAYGEIPEGLQINHRCKTKDCVNPKHLYAGTQSDNMKDRHKDGNDDHLIRLAKERQGTNHHNAVLDEEKVRYIRTSGKSGPKLSKELGISTATVYQVKSRKTWNHVGD